MLIGELARDTAAVGCCAALTVIIYDMRCVGISPHGKLCQRVMIHLSMALEDGLGRAGGPAYLCAILCRRGTLHPLAYWLDRGWPEGEIFAFTGTKRHDHYRWYEAVIQLVTAAVARRRITPCGRMYTGLNRSRMRSGWIA